MYAMGCKITLKLIEKPLFSHDYYVSKNMPMHLSHQGLHQGKYRMVAFGMLHIYVGQ